MVIQTRFRAIAYPLVLYALSASIGGYFIWHAMNGERGLKTRVANKAKIAELSSELDGLRAEHRSLERKAGMLQTNSVDRDLLDEEARLSLGRLHRNEVVILLPKAAGN